MAQPKHISIIVIADERNAIGKNGDLLCHLPNDLKYFKRITEHHTIVMGRKTFDSLPKGALPNRHNIVLTNDKNAHFKNATVCHSLNEVWEKCKNESEVFFVGGGQIYKTVIDYADKLYLTRIHHTFAGVDTFFPEIDLNKWKLIEEEKNKADEKHQYDYTFLTYVKIKE
jgi:dihydrofolate reductase